MFATSLHVRIPVSATRRRRPRPVSARRTYGPTNEPERLDRSLRWPFSSPGAHHSLGAAVSSESTVAPWPMCPPSGHDAAAVATITIRFPRRRSPPERAVGDDARPARAESGGQRRDRASGIRWAAAPPREASGGGDSRRATERARARPPGTPPGPPAPTVATPSPPGCDHAWRWARRRSP